MRTLLLFSLIFSLSIRLLSQGKTELENFKDALLKTKDGAKLVYTGDKHSFTLDIVSKNIKESVDPNFISIDDLVFQSIILPLKPRSDRDTLTMEQQHTELMAYMKEQLTYFKKEMNIKCEGLKYEWVEINNKSFLFWHYDMPKTDKHIEKQMYISTLCFDHVLNLNTPLEKKKGDLDKSKELLFSLAKTLKLNNSSIDLKKMYKELRRG